MLPNIFTLLQILATLPVSTAEPERVFSRVTQTMTALRASVAEDRLEALILIQIYRDCPAIAVNPVLDYRVGQHNREKSANMLRMSWIEKYGGKQHYNTFASLRHQFSITH